MKKIPLLVAAAITATVAFITPVPASANMDADNTTMNKQEQVTADQQGENAADLKITQDIRKAVMQNKSLSQYAHNVKIITRDGKVTLKGPVRSEKEKKIIGNVAKKVAGKGKVANELEVTPSK
jgi:hyperosmotically inducible periplasmic protein